MSFGRPPNVESFTGSPPLLGSFPIDHEGDLLRPLIKPEITENIFTNATIGECKDFMKQYVKCLKENKNNNGKCRELSKAYLQCRMDK